MELGSCVALTVHRPVATALIGLLAWEPPYASGVALKRQKKKGKKRKEITFQKVTSALL